MMTLFLHSRFGECIADCTSNHDSRRCASRRFLQCARFPVYSVGNSYCGRVYYNSHGAGSVRSVLYTTQASRDKEIPKYSVYTAVSRSSERFSIQGTIQRGARQLYTARWAVVYASIPSSRSTSPGSACSRAQLRQATLWPLLRPRVQVRRSSIGLVVSFEPSLTGVAAVPGIVFVTCCFYCCE